MMTQDSRHPSRALGPPSLPLTGLVFARTFTISTPDDDEYNYLNTGSCAHDEPVLHNTAASDS